MDTSTALEASSSSSPSSSSSTTSSSSPYDVFLSFGEDTRKTFTDHLYWTMKDAGIDFFMEENESIRRGENISDKVKQIIEGSKVSVIVFSSRYADSIWCLEELVQIMECRRTLKQMVLPIFYDLSPSDVIGTFVLAFQKHRERFHEDTDIQEKLRRWTDALTAAAGLTVWTEALTAAAGLTVRVFRTTNGYEGMFIREIIAEITVGIAFPELQRLDSPELEDIDSTEHTDIASSVSSANSPFSLETLKKKRHEPDRSDSTSRKFSETWKVRVPADILPDEYSWRKYGQRDILNSPYPRSYYRCTYRDTHGCGATKQVERDRNDPEMLTVTYRGVHVCTVAELGFAEGRDEIQKSGLEQLQRGLLQKPKPFIQAPQPFHQLQMLTPLHHQLMLQNMTSPSAANDESRRLRMLLNCGLGKDGLANSVGDVVPNIGSHFQAGGPILPHGDTDMMIKLKMPQLHQQQLQQQKLQQQQLEQQQLQQHAVSNQQSQNSKLNPYQQDKIGGAGSITMDGSMSNSFRGSDQWDDKDTDMLTQVEEKNGSALGRQPLETQLEPCIAKFISLICNIGMMKQHMMEIGYNADKLPLGKLSKSTILKGYNILQRISDVIGSSNRKLIEQLSGEFYTVIPHDFGFKKMHNFVIDTPQKLKHKLEMVEALGEIEVATKLLKDDTGMQGDPLYSSYQRLHCELTPVGADSHEFDMITKYLHNTHAKTHSTYTVDIVQIFRTSKEGEVERFRKFSSTKNRMLLWHGSRLTNWAGILSQGLRIAPPEAPVTGYMFGKGVYFADMFSKSANYCYASNGCTSGVLLLCEVALGDMAELLTAKYDADKLPVGKLSTKGVGGTEPDFSEAQLLDDGVVVPLGKPKKNTSRPKGSLLYNEYIVYNVEQIRMRYVVQVNFNYKL